MKRTGILFVVCAGVLGVATVAALLKSTPPARAAAINPPVSSRSSPLPVREVSGAAKTWHVPPAATGPRIQVALLLDTSGSMDGLINQARSQLWAIVNDLLKATKDGKRPSLELALYEYGNPSRASSPTWIRQIAPFTDDLDGVSEALNALTTAGGDEYCGEAIQHATNDLNWSTSEGDLKLIFIAGNEAFNQGFVNPVEAVRRAEGKGITVNTVFCGDQRDGDAPGWKQGAVVANGRFLIINQNQAIVEVAAPQDAEIAELGQKLNSTYVPYGATGSESFERQAAQDRTSMGISRSNFAQRTMTKGSRAYNNSGWDLVDAYEQKTVDVKQMNDRDLPPELKGKDAAEREQWIAARKAERERIQSRIRELSVAREKFVAQAHAATGAVTLDSAMIAALREEAKRARFEIE